jgi:hypothetical protein
VDELNVFPCQDDPTLSEDMLTILFEVEGDIYTSSRLDVADPWRAPSRVDELSTGQRDATPELSSDGLTVHFTRGPELSSDVMVARRGVRGDPWGTPELVPELTSGEGEVSPAPTRDLLMIAFGSTRSGGAGSTDIYLSTRAATDAPWSAPVPIVEVNTGELDAAPVWTSPLVLYFASERPTGAARGIWRAERPDTASAFDRVEPVMELNTTGDDADPWVSPDERVIYFARGGSGETEIWVAVRTL